MKPHLVNKHPNHVVLGTLERAERTTKEELQVVLLALHAHAEQDAAMCIEVEPQIVRHEVSEPLRIQTEVSATDGIVLAYERAITDADHDP